jgi:histidine triad (HIT) family protein
MSSCIFCEIVSKKSPAHILYEDEHILSFLDIAPMNEGHALVIPKQHHANLREIPPNVLSHLAVKLQLIASSILKSVGSEAFNILQNNGQVAGQVRSLFLSFFGGPLVL